MKYQYTFEDLSQALVRVEKSPQAAEVATFVEDLVVLVAARAIEDQEAFMLQHTLKNIRSNDEAIRANCRRLSYYLWDVIEEAESASQAPVNAHCFEMVRDGLRAIFLEGERLRREGWEPVYPYLRAYYERKVEGKTVASYAFTAYENEKGLQYFNADESLMKALTPSLDKNTSLKQLEKAIPREIGNTQLQRVHHGYALVSEFQALTRR